MVRARRRWSIASRIFALQLVAVLVVAGALTLILWLSSRQSANETATRVSLAVASTLAHDPAVVSGVQAPQPTARLQPLALEEMQATGVDFVTIMDPSGTRFTHPTRRRSARSTSARSPLRRRDGPSPRRIRGPSDRRSGRSSRYSTTAQSSGWSRPA